MSFFDFIKSLPFTDDELAYIFISFFTFFVAFGIYKFVKDWLPW